MSPPKIDGCNSFHYYLSFMLPLSKPGLASVIIYQALFAWNEYIFALTFFKRQRCENPSLDF